jgi:hypothetical protein
MNAEQKAEWLEVKAKGRGRYLLVEGIIKSGGIYAILLLIANYFFKYGFTASKVSEYLWNGETVFRFFFGVIFFGLWMGLFDWYFNERQFRKSEKNKA